MTNSPLIISSMLLMFNFFWFTLIRVDSMFGIGLKAIPVANDSHNDITEGLVLPFLINKLL